MSADQDVSATMECVGCKSRIDLDPRTVTDQPMCEKCFMPMIIVNVRVRELKPHQKKGRKP
jgi:hypothetical protein